MSEAKAGECSGHSPGSKGLGGETANNSPGGGKRLSGRGDPMAVLWHNPHCESRSHSRTIREGGMNPGSVSPFTFPERAVSSDSVFQCSMAARSLGATGISVFSLYFSA